jgi:hypothetical protein
MHTELHTLILILRTTDVHAVLGFESDSSHSRALVVSVASKHSSYISHLFTAVQRTSDLKLQGILATVDKLHTTSLD